VPDSFRIYGGVALLILIWGTTWSAIAVNLRGMGPLTAIAVRFALAGVLLLIFGRVARVRWQGGPRLRSLWAIETTFGFVISYGVVYWAEQWVPSGLVAVLFSTMPLFVAVLAHFWLTDERLGARAIGGLLVGIGGTAVIFSEDLQALAGADIAVPAATVLLAAAAAAVSHTAVKKWGGGFHPVNLATVPMILTGLVMGAFALWFERDRPIALGLDSGLALVYLAVVGTIVTFTLYYWLLARTRATRLALITYAIPLVALLIGTLVFDEPWSAKTLAGSGLVVLGVVLAT
jgi:drug/metabolite transporter (DMT)-like permease